MVILTNEERSKFVLYLRQEAQNYNLLVEQLEKLPFPQERMSKPMKLKVALYSAMANELERVEEKEIYEASNVKDRNI